MAQQESESLSKNTKMGIHYRFQQGKVMVNARNFLGYDKDEDGHLIVNPEQAEIVNVFSESTLREKAAGKRQGLRVLSGIPVQVWHDDQH